MSCPENTLPCGCTDNPCGCKISSDDVAYQGPNLSCTGIENCDSMTVAIKKLNDYACSIDLVQNIITNITNNISLYNQFVTIVNRSVDCDTVFDCLNTTTTTTTTTINCNCVEFIIDEDDINDATGNSLPQLNNVLFLDGPKDVICSGGNLPDTFDVPGASYKYCINVDAIPLLSLFYYKDNVQQPALNSSITDSTNPCTINGNCTE